MHPENLTTISIICDTTYNFTTFDSDAVGLETGNVIINGNVTDNHFNLTLSDNAYLYGWIMDDSGSVTVSGTVSDNEVTIPDGSDFLSGFYFKSASSASEINFEQAIEGNQFNMNFYPEIVLITSGSGVINLKGNTDETQLSSVNHDALIQQSGSGICYGSPC